MGDFDAAISAAAELLGASAFPVFAGSGADVAGFAAAIRLAERLGGAIDHAAAEASLRDSAVLHDVGLMLVSPGEARQRADTILIVGDGPLQAWPDLPGFLFAEGPTHLSDATPARRILALTGREFVAGHGRNDVRWFGTLPDAIPGLLGAVRARVNGRPLVAGYDPAAADAIAGIMQGATYGVALWSPADLDALAIEMLVGLVKDLNAETRWSGISVAADASAAGAAMAAGWMTGLPLRSGFGRGAPEHDPWRFDARRLVESGEADAVVWISALGEPPPEWLALLPAVILGPPPLPPAGDGQVALPVGRPGVDHDAILYDRRTGTLVQKVATARRDAASVADVLERISARLPAQ